MLKGLGVTRTHPGRTEHGGLAEETSITILLAYVLPGLTRAELSMGVWRRKRPLQSSWHMFLFVPVSDLVYEVEFNWAHFLEKSLAKPFLSRILAVLSDYEV